MTPTQWFVLVTVPIGMSSSHEATDTVTSLIGPFSTLDAAHQWRDQRITADGATSEILTPEMPR
jgi:hypothetical protein